MKIWVCTIALFVLASGCGSDAPVYEKGKVSGTVTHDGTPLPAGRVVFLNEQGPGEEAEIGPDGKYSAELVTGPTKVLVEYREPTPPGNPDRPEMPMPGKSYIPEKYSQFASSGLTLDVKSGESTFDIALEGEGDAPKP